MSIVVNNITKLYGEQKALNNVSFTVETGQIVGFLGPNGAGKSTMMKIITCYIPPTQGAVKVCGFDILDQSIDVKKQIGYLPEHNPLYLDMYVKEFLEFVGGLYKIKNIKGRVQEMIELTGLQVEQKKKNEEEVTQLMASIQPKLLVSVEADNAVALEGVKMKFRRWLHALDAELKLPF